MLLWVISSYVIYASAIRCLAGQHKFLESGTLDKHECPERAACFVFIYANSNETQSKNETTISGLDAYVERGCLEEAEVPLFHNQIQCRQLLNLQKRLTPAEIIEGQRCVCTTDFCNISGAFYYFIIYVFAFLWVV